MHLINLQIPGVANIPPDIRLPYFRKFLEVNIIDA